MELSDSLKLLFIETARTLKGPARRLFMARTTKELGPGGQRRAEAELGWNRETIRKGTHELESGFTCRMLLRLVVAKRPKSFYPIYLTILKVSLIARAKLTLSFVTKDFTLV